MNTKIMINNIPVSLIFEENNSIMEIKVISQLNTLIYTSRINKDNIRVNELVSHSWIPVDQVDRFRNELEKHIIENI